jgi:xylulokinase
MTAYLSYKKMNTEAAGIPLGSEGLKIYPFGNGAERMLENKQVGAHFMELNLNVHNHRHLFRAAQEGIVFSFAYGLKEKS